MNPYIHKQYQTFLNAQLSQQNKILQQSIQNYKEKISSLEQKINKLTIENKILREFLDQAQSPVEIETLYLSCDTSLKELKINSLQSGSALNIGKLITNTTNSDMDMEMGSNSMNSGDANYMEHIHPNENIHQENT